MKLHSFTLTLQTDSEFQLIDITDKIKSSLDQSFPSVLEGLVQIASHHTTAGVCINESCDALAKDFVKFAKQVANPEANWEHNKIAVDGRPNAHSHLLAYFVPHSETVLLTEGKLQLGKWQRVFFVELDGPREVREVKVTVIT